MERTVVDPPSFLPVPAPGQQLRSSHQLPTSADDAQAGRIARRSPPDGPPPPWNAPHGTADQPGVRLRCYLDLRQPPDPRGQYPTAP
ncbi:DUF6207 family protein [Streptomyces sp. NPDC047853]|uniref:DUF6207 family protein n=1 Tax=unclassified Streptomyces TaxID=2593676 RepID=UPI0034511CEB